jgi:hypothetical protein
MLDSEIIELCHVDKDIDRKVSAIVSLDTTENVVKLSGGQIEWRSCRDI